MQNNPRLSVIVITYRHERYIAQCLDSILGQQTDFPFEVIVGEDGSDDRTAAICMEYANRYPEKVKVFVRDRANVITIDGKPTGKYNFLECIKSCKGEYIAICEGDDYWNDPLKLQKQLDFLDKHPEYVMSCHDANVVDDHGNIIETSRLKPSDKTHLSPDALAKGGYVLTLTMCYRNVPLIFPPEYFRSPNGDLFLQALLSEFGGAGYQADIAPASYRTHTGGVWSLQPQLHRWRQAIRTYEQLAGYFKRTNRTELSNHYANWYNERQRELLTALWRNKERKKALQIIAPVVKFNFTFSGIGTAILTALRLLRLLVFLTLKM
ncbi:MAG: glycosyltransferase [Flavobacteriales bacterium]